MTHRYYADPTFAGYRNAVSAMWCRVQQAINECADCGRALASCRCGGGG